MVEARDALLARGGAQKANVFTRFLLAFSAKSPGRRCHGACRDDPVAALVPVDLSKCLIGAERCLCLFSCCRQLKPIARNPRGVHIPELFATGAPAASSRAPHQSKSWAAFFGTLDRTLKHADPFWPVACGKACHRSCLAFVSERLNGEDGLGAIYPAIANSVMMYDALGYPDTHPERAIARKAVDKLLVIKDSEAYCQPCVSPVWDTALVCHTLLKPEALRRLHAWTRPSIGSRRARCSMSKAIGSWRARK